MPCKVDYADLESVTKFLDKILKKASKYPMTKNANKDFKQGIKLSKMIKDKYTEIKPHYDRAN